MIHRTGPPVPLPYPYPYPYPYFRIVQLWATVLLYAGHSIAVCRLQYYCVA